MNTMGTPRSMTGKTGLITGGTGGIRRAAAIGLSSIGARVDIRRPDHHAAVECQRRPCSVPRSRD